MTITESLIKIKNAKLEAFFKVYNEELDELFDLIDSYSEEELNKKPNDKTWSVMQVVHHLMISETSSINNIQKRLKAGRDSLKKASATSKLRAMVLVSSLKQPIKLKAPEIATTGIPEYADLESTKKIWMEHRTRIIQFLDNLPDEILESECFRHPVIGIMDAWGMLDFFDAHFQRHFKQINKTLWKMRLHS